MLALRGVLSARTALRVAPAVATRGIKQKRPKIRVVDSQPQPFPLTSGVEPYFWGFKESDFEGKPELIKRAFHVQNGSNQDVQKYLMRRAVALFGLGPNDTGSAPVQVAVMTYQIENLSRHMHEHHKDNHNKYRLHMLVSRRASMMRYLKRKDFRRYMQVIEALGIRDSVFAPPTFP